MAEERKIRRKFTSEEKAAAVKRHVVGGEPVSAICEDLGLAPNMFYCWRNGRIRTNAALTLYETQGIWLEHSIDSRLIGNVG